MKPLPEALRASMGLRVDQIDTPALVIDLDAMERNITRMADFARKHQVRWRPHAKAHKCAELALWLQRAGATGACVQKTAEAEALAAAGVHDITITNQVIALPKLMRVARLAERLQAQGGQLTLAVDSADGIHRLAEAMAQAAPNAHVGVLVEIDVGQGRCGVPPGEPARALAHTVARQPRLHFAGLHAYHGGAQHLRSAAGRRDAIAAAVQAARHTRDLIVASGLAVPLVTGAGTGTLVHEAASGLYGELQAGSFLFMDESYAQNEREPAQPGFEHALFIKTQVISRQGDRAVCDAGHKSHAIDSGMPRVALLPPERALRYSNGGDEHGLLTTEGPKALLPAIGRMLWLIPGHCDPTVNLHDYMIGVRGGLEHGTVERIFRVDARGALT
ncbi:MULTISPECIES: DSD1 family PLP-dependent enzyme [unclassified Simplicispira]|uniref:DSD1 family PLP-dependent enzyme n=1 Tax=unclassified Simplicispira TaxID=2630407 RepID=UPI000D5D89FD|nr:MULTISPECIES: DSD1 family PLP-dependent enzyme [unclassified Simplicispira]PVY57167.1 D-serine deaminase-like pyridoxal phosphate-dependent protein [Simplicispira sp. 125]REG18112.1 D-serine deaminase-like pyridoxal phosphate-dependent protein [Simplicispira sp. 110]